MRTLNTLRIKATTKYFAEINSVSQLKNILSNETCRNEKILVIGNGSNILLPKYYDGIVLKINIHGKKIIYEDTEFVVLNIGAGENWDELVEYTVSKNWGGIENMVMIPSTTGAASVQNIASYGQSLHERLLSLDAINISNGKLRSFTTEECDFGYRDSIFKQKLKGKYIIVSIKLKLRKNPAPNTTYKFINEELPKIARKPYTIKDVCEVIKKIRIEKLPDPAKIGTAGSFFKNPFISKEKLEELQKICPDFHFYDSNENDDAIVISAAWLIEAIGFADKKIGGCSVWKKQPLNIVNRGNATPSEIVELMDAIKDKIYEKYGIILENEVEII